MQQIDTAAIEQCGIPRLLLMEHAGLALANAIVSLSPRGALPVLICCGTGYNGGDGLCAARHLHNWGDRPHVVLTGRVAQLRDDPLVYAGIVQRLGIPLMELERLEQLGSIEPWVASCGLIVDALLGVGLRGAVREPTASLIDRLNRSGKPIVSADIPSGLDGDSGLPQGRAVNATITVTFGLPKQGCFVGQGPAYVGTLIIDSITMPPTLLERS